MFARSRFLGKPYLKTRIAPALMIASLAEEADALKSLLTSEDFTPEAKFSVSGLQFEEFVLRGRGSSNYANCVVVCSKGMGKLEAAITTAIACIELDPSFVFLVGVSGGRRFRRTGRRLSLGDVIVATEILDVDMRKIYGPDKMAIKPKHFAADPNFLRIAEYVCAGDWFENVRHDIRCGVIPQVHFGSVVSSDIVMRDSENFFDWISQAEVFKSWPSNIPIGIEMEGAGVALAVERCAPEIGFLVIKGVSDYADAEKSTDEKYGRHLARYSAAAFAVSMLRNSEFQSRLRFQSRSRSRQS